MSEKQEWDELLPFACFAYNTTPHSITTYTPYEVLFGHKCNLPGALQKGLSPTYNYDDVVSMIKRRIQEASQISRSKLIKAKSEQSKNEKTKGTCFQKNDLVWLSKEQRNKLDPLWEGPFEIQ